MVESSMAAPVNVEQDRWRIARTATAIGFASALALAACGSSGSNNHESASSSTSTTIDTLNGPDNCTAASLNDEIANVNFAESESLYPPLYDVVEGKKKQVPAGIASQRLRAQICGDSRSLATLKVFLDLRESRQLPDAGTLKDIEKRIELYHDNAKAAAADEQVVFAALDPQFLVPTSEFAVTKGQAVEYQAVRGSNSKITGMKTQVIETTGSLTGFEIGFNHDDKDLTVDQKALDEKLQSLILVTDDGTVVVNELFATGGIKFDKNEQHVPASANQKKNVHNQGNARTRNTLGGGSGGGTSSAGSNGGTNGQSQGHGPGGNGPSCIAGHAGCNGNTTGSGGGSGGGGGEGGPGTTTPGTTTETTTPTTTPETTTPTTVPRTTPTTVPRTTPTTAPPTTTPPTKPGDPGNGGA